MSLAKCKVKSPLLAGRMCGSSLSSGVLETGILLGSGCAGGEMRLRDLTSAFGQFFKVQMPSWSPRGKRTRGMRS